MLIEFTVENFRSFQHEVTLSLEATSLKERDRAVDAAQQFEVPELKTSLLKSALVYGANASGKSNLALAMAMMRGMVINSARGQVQDTLPVEPYRLNVSSRTEPSKFEIVFFTEGRQYRYGYAASRKEVHSEWLYVTVGSSENLLFERDGRKFTLEPPFSEEATELPAKTRNNALFVSVVAQFNGPIATDIVEWFRSTRVVHADHEPSNAVTLKLLGEDDTRAEVVGFVRRLDLAILDITTNERKMADTLPKDMPDDLREMLDRWGPDSVTEIHTLHEVFDDAANVVDQELFSLERNESQGTRRLFALAGPIVNALKHGTVVVLDEFDIRLHPNLSRALLDLFASPGQSHNAQIVATTHNTRSLSPGFLRRDEYWFVEKDRQGRSSLYSLAEFKTRNDAAYEKQYLAGRFGAIPDTAQLSLFHLLEGEASAER